MISSETHLLIFIIPNQIRQDRSIRCGVDGTRVGASHPRSKHAILILLLIHKTEDHLLNHLVDVIERAIQVSRNLQSHSP